MNLFFTPNIDLTAGTYKLSPEESSHCIRVLRLHIGDFIYLTNGKGDLCKAEIIDENSKCCCVNISETISEYNKRSYKLHIAIAPTKNIDRVEWFLEKATEIGIDEITPIICQHSERRKINIERLNKIITSAMKQSLKAYHPLLHEETNFEKFISQEFSGEKYIGYCGENTSKLKDIYEKGKDAIILIGPEGDFSKEEVNFANEKGFTPINLGINRYRTETAAVVACHTIHLLNE
jgi:16S rRNA (uracil1498-N3)-methyltransferase